MKDDGVSNFRHWERLERKYSIRVKRLNIVVEELKQRITAIAAKVRWYQGWVDSYKQNKRMTIQSLIIECKTIATLLCPYV